MNQTYLTTVLINISQRIEQAIDSHLILCSTQVFLPIMSSLMCAGNFIHKSVQRCSIGCRGNEQ